MPLAAVLIGYPIAYVPISPDQAVFLPQEPLDIYEVALDHNADISSFNHKLIVLRFSCPHRLGNVCPQLSVPNLIQKLACDYGSLLETIGIGMLLSHHMATFDRVAL